MMIINLNLLWWQMQSDNCELQDRKISVVNAVAKDSEDELNTKKVTYLFIYRNAQTSR